MRWTENVGCGYGLRHVARPSDWRLREVKRKRGLEQMCVCLSLYSQLHEWLLKHHYCIQQHLD